MPLGRYTLDLNKNINNDFPLEKATRAVKSKAIQYIKLARMGHLKERTDSNRVADQPCSSGAPAAACTEVISIHQTSADEGVITESVPVRYIWA